MQADNASSRLLTYLHCGFFMAEQEALESASLHLPIADVKMQLLVYFWWMHKKCY